MILNNKYITKYKNVKSNLTVLSIPDNYIYIFNNLGDRILIENRCRVNLCDQVIYIREIDYTLFGFCVIKNYI